MGSPLSGDQRADDVAASRGHRAARPLPIAPACFDQAPQVFVGAARDSGLGDVARQADGVGAPAGPARLPSPRPPHAAAGEAGSQVLGAPLRALGHSFPRDSVNGLLIPGLPDPPVSHDSASAASCSSSVGRPGSSYSAGRAYTERAAGLAAVQQLTAASRRRTPARAARTAWGGPPTPGRDAPRRRSTSRTRPVRPRPRCVGSARPG